MAIILRMMLLALGALCFFPKNAAAAEPDQATQFLCNWLKNGPLAGERPLTVTFQERSLSSMYYLMDQEGNILFWVKCRLYDFSKGGYFTKTITAPFTLETYALGQIRRAKSRQLIDKINAEAQRILMAPYYEELPEYILGNDLGIPHHLRRNVVTFWQHIKGKQNPYCKSPYKWSPSEYPPWVIEELVNHLYTISKLANRVLEASHDPGALKKALSPEHGAAVSKKIVTQRDNLFNALGIGSMELRGIEIQLDDPNSPLHLALKEKAQQKLAKINAKKIAIAQELNLDTSLSLDDLTSQLINSLEPKLSKSSCRL